jgi:hypothetical protein
MRLFESSSRHGKGRFVTIVRRQRRRERKLLRKHKLRGNKYYFNAADAVRKRHHLPPVRARGANVESKS